MTRKNAVLRWFEGMNDLDVDVALEAFAAESTYLAIGYDEGVFRRLTVHGKSEIMAYLGRFCARIVPGTLEYTVTTIGEGGNTVYAEWSDVALFKSGEEYTNEGIFAFDFDDDNAIVAARPYYDVAAVMAIQDFRDRDLGSNQTDS